jgi:aquaporin Z
MPQDPRTLPAAHEERRADEWRRLLAEAFGTFVLTFFDAGAKMAAALSGETSAAAQAIVPGLVVAAMIYSLGHRSGAHINPAVTFAFALRRVFPWRRVPGYVAVQLAGALLAALVLLALFGAQEHVGATMPRSSPYVALALEAILTVVLVSVILGTSRHHRVIGPDAALAVGATIIACNILGKGESGASMNPARSFGPALVGGAMPDYWIYVVGPLAGAAIAVGLAFLIHGRQNHDEQKAAKGE